MSEFTRHKEERIEKLKEIFEAILKGKHVKTLYEIHQGTICKCVPSDVVYLVHELVGQEIPMPALKKGINKILNLLYRTISEHPAYHPPEGSYLWVMLRNNAVMMKKLEELKPFVKQINQRQDQTNKTKSEAARLLGELLKFESYYAIKENVLFPMIEKHLPEFRCLSVMWSFHDDIRRNLKAAVKELTGKMFDLQAFNKLTGDLYFNMNAIKFREEQILYPLLAEIIPANELEALFSESLEIGFPYYQPAGNFEKSIKARGIAGKIDLGTGSVDAEQIRLILNHLPVDITFVDENNKVRYYSAPPKRIFRRTNAILGREVHNCHPPESEHVVEQIVAAFKAGKKDSASFWIDMKGEKLLIQYFAVREDDGTYKGVIEVSQEITEIQKLEGQQRLLDWDK
ncbi:PAS domain-containing protein [Prolixibacteraceae bacterium Z1-6]|uniref:PAS domain-containing protein n=1 Tax=Draconibacterium aestuarii TaxID=2998507 RepID=A0A9X3J571_9BACT|nr:PAS domain-containing protein [Prolixibacteraceae bacterium Z1-6]